jgi:opacity protein-like surface antigen
MTKYLFAAAALAVIAAPATARDNSAYFGLEVGAMWPMKSHVEVASSGADVLDIDHKLGVDGDLIAGYDFGMFRAEFEGSHKWSKHGDYDRPVGPTDGHGHTSGYSTMINAMVDVGGNDSVGFYAGAGAGLAWLHQRARIGNATIVDINDNEQFAWQGIAGIRAPTFRHFDIGLKYRYFNAGHLREDGVRSRFRSHSVLASLIYNFADNAAPPPPPPMLPPPPPPPPPPATQTCPDGTVILATDACPAPPPPPPPPEPTPERGQ